MLRNKFGQMSMMFIVLIAIALVCLALTMNWNRTAQLKTQCQVAATSAVSVLASRMASYGHGQIMSQLGGRHEKCDWTGVFAAFLFVLFIIVIIIVSIYCQACGAALASSMTALYVALALAIATLVLQVVVVQPAITKMWNKLQKNIVTTQDQFLEAGLQAALMAAVTDSEEMPDVLDYNMNGLWNVPGAAGSSNDSVSRLVYHYTNRLAKMNFPDTSRYRAFQDELRSFMRDLGMDSTQRGCCANLGLDTNFCNPNCFYSQADGDIPAVTDLCQQTPFQNYPFSYDPLFCQRVNAPGTLVGLLGRDDSNVNYRKDAANLVSATETTVEPLALFRVEDSDGLLFPLLWQLKRIDEHKVSVGAPGRLILPDVATSPAMVGNEAPLACPGTPGNGVWRSGNEFYCQRNFNGTNYTAPHYAGCVEYDAACNDINDSTGAQCLCPASPAQNLWDSDQIDADWVSMREIAQKSAVITQDYRNLLIGRLDEIGVDLGLDITNVDSTMRRVQADFNAWYGQLNSWYSDIVHTHTSVTVAGVNYEVFCEGSARAVETSPAPTGTNLQGVINCEKYYATTAPVNFAQCLADCGAWQGQCNARQAACAAATAACNACTACVCAPPPDPCGCPDCSADCNNAAVTCADAAAFCAAPGNVASCISRPRSLAVNGIAFDGMAVDCRAGSAFLTELPTHSNQAAASAPLFTPRIALLEEAQTQASILLPALRAAIDTGFARIDNIQPLYDLALQAYVLEGTESSITYGWEGAPPKNSPLGTLGRLHIVKVDAYTTKRCGGWIAERGSLARSCGTDLFPWIATKKKGMFKRCYYITETDGCVKARVTRYDEDPSGTLNFANGVTRLWQFFGRHPNSIGTSQANAAIVRANCFGQDQIMAGATLLYNVPNSFMINRMVSTPLNAADYTSTCRNAVRSLTEQGFVTEVCAKYYLVGNQYQIKFISCYGDASCQGK